MPFFSNAQNVVINDGHFIELAVDNSVGPTGIDILLEASIPEAAHDSSARDPPPRCFPGTREEYVEDILHWAVPPVASTSMPLYWMKGPAGVGKSAVAQTCVEKLRRQGIHCPSFFFSINGRNKYQKFFPSIAYQLSTIYPDYRDLIDRKIRLNKTLVNKTMETQFWGLIVEPLQELEGKGKGIGKRVRVFVDGLDECESQDAQCEIVEIVAAAAREGAAPLCWAFFSRPEPHIETTFSGAGISSLCYRTALPVSRDADRDIELYLHAGFEHILRRRGLTVNSPWPSHSDMKELVRAAGGLFIFAKTILRFVGQEDSLNLDKLLHLIIAVITNPNEHGITTGGAFAELDAFYMLIMQRVPVNVLPFVRQVLAVLCWKGYSGAIMIANTLELSRVELESVCHHMSSVLHFQPQHKALELDPTVDTNRSFLETKPPLSVEAWDIIRNSLGGSISFYHKSFRDFLQNRQRSGIYSVSTAEMDRVIDKQEWKLALRFQRSHCWRGSELVRAPGAPHSGSNLSYPLTNKLVNSLVEAWIFSRIDGEKVPFEADFDPRQQLYVTSTIITSLPPSQHTVRGSIFHCVGYRKYIPRASLGWLKPGEFSNFNIAAFKEGLERRQRETILRPYYGPTPPFLRKPQGRIESGLYIRGRDSKSVFWYWEIDYDSQSYRHFRSLDLAEGERLFRKEWPA